MSAWSPSYRDCDNIISDIYALTHTARMRRRAELGLDKLRISEMKDGECVPTVLPRPTISTIQSRPLPTPAPGPVYAASRQPEHIYQSPVRLGQQLYPRQAQYGLGGRGGAVPVSRQQCSNIPSARYHAPTGSRIPLAVSPPAATARRLPASSELAKERRVSSPQQPRHPAGGRLGARAVTELDFSRHHRAAVANPGPRGDPCLQKAARAPSVTDTSEMSTATSAASGSAGLLPSDTCIRKGVMWVQQEKMFSRWKERFIILTTSYLHIFKKSTSRLSDMGTFVNKIRLSEIENLSIEERKGYLTLVLATQRDSRLLLRKTEGIRDWQRSLEAQLGKERQRHREMMSTNDFWNRKQFSDCHNNAASQWLLVRDNIGHKYGYLSRMSPSNFHSETEDSGFESLVTVTSDSSSSSSRMVSPHPPAPALANPPPPPMFNVRNGPPPERPHHYQFYNYNNRK